MSALNVQGLAAYDMLKLPVTQLHGPVKADSSDWAKGEQNCHSVCVRRVANAVWQALPSHIRFSTAVRAQNACMPVVSSVAYRTAGKQHWQELMWQSRCMLGMKKSRRSPVWSHWPQHSLTHPHRKALQNNHQHLHLQASNVIQSHSYTDLYTGKSSSTWIQNCSTQTDHSAHPQAHV